MSIAVDQTRLHRIFEAVPCTALERAEALVVLQFVQLAAGVDHDDQPMEHATLQAIAQRLGTLTGLEPGDVLPIPPLPAEEGAPIRWFVELARQLETRGARELAYVLSFLVSVADLELKPEERSGLDELQRALGLDDRRATDLIVLLTRIVAADGAEAEARPRPMSRPE